MMLRIFLVEMFLISAHCYFWEDEEAAERPTPSNLGCFICSQLLSVTKHRVGLSQNQLRAQMYEKCRVLPIVFKDQCFAFVETSLPEIYYSINYDLSTKDICLRLNLCEEGNPFSVITTPEPESSEVEERRTTRVPYDSSFEKENRVETPAEEPREDRIGHKNILEIVFPRKPKPSLPPVPFLETSTEAPRETTTTVVRTTMSNSMESEEKRVTCAFCEKMLENAKNYAVKSKADIGAFATSACGTLPKGRFSDQCYLLADKKITELAKFVDQQVIDALWCAETNRC